jgi:TetR/AcrR family transcriptional repressor of nem operon
MSERTTKERILDAAEELMLEKSFHSVGLTEILKAVKVPKGSFYHHFESKEQFGVEMLKHYVADASGYKRRMLLSSEPEENPRLRLMTYLDSSIDALEDSGGKCPCLVIKLASEVANFSEPMREVLAEGQTEWQGIMITLIEEGLEKNALRCIGDSAEVATVIGDLWTGAMQRAAILRSSEPLREARKFIFCELLTEG